jgi:hypothetical protein
VVIFVTIHWHLVFISYMLECIVLYLA